jgi:hypothetical protein
MNEAGSLDGIIAHLRKGAPGRRHLAEVNQMVRVSSKSVCKEHPEWGPNNVIDLSPRSDSHFESKATPGQWILWDFRDRRVCPTRYTIRTHFLKSWVVEGSVDGSSWVEIDRQTDNRSFTHGCAAVSFDASRHTDFRFIRLTQTAKNFYGSDDLVLWAVEFFGTLFE